MVKDAMFIV